MSRLSWIITIPITLLAVFFAVANRQPTRLNFWPLPWVMDLPLYLLILGCLLVGFLLGTIVAWLSAHGRRQRTRDLIRKVRAQETEIALMRDEQPGAARAGTAASSTALGLPAPQTRSTLQPVGPAVARSG